MVSYEDICMTKKLAETLTELTVTLTVTLAFYICYIRYIGFLHLLHLLHSNVAEKNVSTSQLVATVTFVTLFYMDIYKKAY